MALNLTEQISKLRKKEWVNLQGLIDCSTAYLSSTGSSQTCLSISYLGRGTYNTVYRLVFSDGTELAGRVVNDEGEYFNAQEMQSEIETMRFVRESGLYPDIPVPNVHTWDNTFNNPVSAPYMLMDVVQGVTLDDVTNNNEPALNSLDALPYTQQLYIVKALAKLKASLSRPVPFNELGVITMDATGKGYSVRPITKEPSGPFKSAHELWLFYLEYEMVHAVPEWCKLKEGQFSTSELEPKCTPQKFTELRQLLVSLIPHFKIPQAYSYLVLHHPDLASRNVFFDKESLETPEPKITGVIDWDSANVLPLMLTAEYPSDLMTTGHHPFERTSSKHPDENWSLVPNEWISIGEPTQYPKVFRNQDLIPLDYKPIVIAMVRRFYLRSYFSTCYAEQLHLLYGDTDLAHATLFMDAPYYLKFHETVRGGWMNWVERAKWIRETYWRLRKLQKQGTDEESLIIGPDVYRSSVKPMVSDLRIAEEVPDDLAYSECEDDLEDNVGFSEIPTRESDDNKPPSTASSSKTQDEH